MAYNLQNIRTLLIEGFTDADLRRFCFDEPAFRSVYDELASLVVGCKRLVGALLCVNPIVTIIAGRGDISQPLYPNRIAE